MTPERSLNLVDPTGARARLDYQSRELFRNRLWNRTWDALARLVWRRIWHTRDRMFQDSLAVHLHGRNLGRRNR